MNFSKIVASIKDNSDYTFAAESHDSIIFWCEDIKFLVSDYNTHVVVYRWIDNELLGNFPVKGKTIKTVTNFVNKTIKFDKESL